MERVLAGFARGQAILCGVLALFYAAALSAIGLEFGVLLGLVAGLASFVPYLGTAVGLVASVGVAAVQFWPSWGRPLVALGVFLFGQVVADYVLSPRLVGERVGLHPLWVIFGIFAGGALFGVVGTVVAVPLCAVIGVLARFGMERYRASAPLPWRRRARPSDRRGTGLRAVRTEGVRPPRVPNYQRLRQFARPGRALGNLFDGAESIPERTERRRWGLP